mmetsp:Transcript_11163/g.35283  ORF Transcript_11163/g.35283 Transcript_11163/m.35283 type:complete len:390 (+) Transcript_11163:32-1201(+)
MSLLDRYMDDLESRREKAGSDPSDYEDVGGVAISPESAAGDTVVFKAADIKLALSRPPPPVPDDAASVYSTTSELGAPVGSVSPPAAAAAPPPPPPPSAESPRNRVAPGTSVAALLQQQRQMAEQLRQMQAKMDSERRKRELAENAMEVERAFLHGKPSTTFLLRVVIPLQARFRAARAARSYRIHLLFVRRLQCSVRRWAATALLNSSRAGAVRLQAAARRRACVLERLWLRRERAAGVVQCAFRVYKARRLDDPDLTTSRLVARLLAELHGKGAALAAAEARLRAAAAVDSAESAAVEWRRRLRQTEAEAEARVAAAKRQQREAEAAKRAALDETAAQLAAYGRAIDGLHAEMAGMRAQMAGMHAKAEGMQARAEGMQAKVEALVAA